MEIQDQNELEVAVTGERVPLSLTHACGSSIEEVYAFRKGDVVGDIMEFLELDAIKEFDKTDPVIISAYDRVAVAGRYYSNVLETVVKNTPRGRVKEANAGQSVSEMIPHTWKMGALENTVDGDYMAKARTALEAEQTAFDTAFYRMNRRDVDSVMGYICNLIGGDTNKRYLSFIKESLSHCCYQRAVWRNLFLRKYAEGIETDFEVGKRKEGKGDDGEESDDEGSEDGSEESDDQDFVEERPGVWVDRSGRTPVVDGDVPFGLLWPDPTEVGSPGNSASVRFIAADELMTSVIDSTLADSSDIFVSKAKDAMSLAYDILAGFSGTRDEFGIYGRSLTFITATIKSGDLNAMFKSWGCRGDREGEMGTLAHHLYLKYKIPSGYYRSSGADYLRVRDYLAFSNVLWSDGDGAGRRCVDFGFGVNIQMKYAHWSTRVGAAYQIVAYDGDVERSIPGWDLMRRPALHRGIMVGGLLDYVSQLTVGSYRNLRFFGGIRMVEAMFDIAAAFVTNIGYNQEGQQQLTLFQFDWARVDSTLLVPGDVVLEAGETGVVDLGTVERGCWLVESRASWESVLSNDIRYPIRTELRELTRGDVSQSGAGVVFPRESVAWMSRLLSTLANNVGYSYRFSDVTTVRSLPIKLTNDRVGNRKVFWSRVLDKVVGLEVNGKARLVPNAAQISVRFDSSDMGTTHFRELGALGSFKM